jgi:Fe2+ or Zn2+ uptake regulation protein
MINQLENTELLISAVQDYEGYNRSQKMLLRAFIELAINDVVVMSITSLSKLTGISRAAIYNALKKLEQDKLIENLNVNGEKNTNFKINRHKFNYILEIYNKKKAYQKLNPQN